MPRDSSVGSILGKSCKGLLCLQIPAHSFDGISPPALHGLPGVIMRFISACDHFLQMLILSYNNFISRVSVESASHGPPICSHVIVFICMNSSPYYYDTEADNNGYHRTN